MTESAYHPGGDSSSSDDFVYLEPYDANWLTRAAHEVKLLEEAGVPGWKAVEHVGSTAVPGMSAKAIIDLALAVTCEITAPELREKLAVIGYRWMGDFGLPGREFFRKGNPTDVHLHVVQAGSEHWRAWLLFRDFLRDNPDWFRRYESEKSRLARLFANNRAAYTQAKGKIVREVLAAAENQAR